MNFKFKIQKKISEKFFDKNSKKIIKESTNLLKVLFAAKLSAKTRQTVETRFLERVFGVGRNEM